MRNELMIVGLLMLGVPSTALAKPSETTTDAAHQPRAAEAQAPEAEEEGKELQGAFLQVEAHLSALSDALQRSVLAGSSGYGMRGGYRHQGWGVFLHLEHNLWLETDREPRMSNGAINAAAGVEVSYADGFARSSVAVGPSILASETVFDERGCTGLFVDARPVGLRLEMHEKVAFGIDPLSLGVVAPVLGEIPLVKVQYRSTAQLEVSW